MSHHIHPWSHDLRRQQSALKQQEKAPCPCVCVCARGSGGCGQLGAEGLGATCALSFRAAESVGSKARTVLKSTMPSCHSTLS